MVKNELISTLQNSNPDPFPPEKGSFKNPISKSSYNNQTSLFFLLNVNFSIKIRFFSQKELHLSQIIQ